MLSELSTSSVHGKIPTVQIFISNTIEAFSFQRKEEKKNQRQQSLLKCELPPLSPELQLIKDYEDSVQCFSVYD
jgi:hypothetical protein